jgi:hypothetical protein
VDISPVDISENTQAVEPDYFIVKNAEVVRQSKPAFTFTENCDQDPSLDPSTTVVIGQGAGDFFEGGGEKKLYSEKLATCLALLLNNIKTGRVALFHIDANSPKGIDQSVLNKISEGGGLVVMQAIRGSQSIPSEETNKFFAEHMSVNTLIADDILINTGSAFWSVTTDGSELEVDIGEKGQKFKLEKENLTNISETSVETDQLKIISNITKDSNISNYLKAFKEKSTDEVLDQLNYLATFVSKDKSKWVDRWVLASSNDKKTMVATISSLLSNK